MHWKHAVLAAAGALIISGQSAAPDPILAHYRAYRSAMTANDLAAAETEAAAALQASVARDGDGGRTGVLAMNLAQLRLSRNEAAQAHDPALQAFNIASARGAQSGVDPLLARLILGRSQLASGDADEGRARLTAAIADMQARPDLRSEGYLAASDLGRWSFDQRRYRESAAAWDAAAQFSDAVADHRDLARGEARIGQGTALLTLAASSENFQRSVRSIDTRIHLTYADVYADADTALSEAQELLAPLAHADSGPGELTEAQRAYAWSLAWRNVLKARLQSLGRAPLPPHNSYREVQTEDIIQDSVPRCALHVTVNPRPRFPAPIFNQDLVGAVVVRVVLDEGGRLIDAKVAASVPNSFQETVAPVVAQWRYERADDAEPGCRMEQSRFVVVYFS